MMTTVKVTLTLPQTLMREMREVAPPRGLSKLVAEAIEAYLEAKKKKELEQRLIAGYKATAAEMLAFTKEWEAADFADWDRHVPPYDMEGVEDVVANPSG